MCEQSGLTIIPAAFRPAPRSRPAGWLVVLYVLSKVFRDSQKTRIGSERHKTAQFTYPIYQQLGNQKKQNRRTSLFACEQRVCVCVCVCVCVVLCVHEHKTVCMHAYLVYVRVNVRTRVAVASKGKMRAYPRLSGAFGPDVERK